MGVDGTGDFAIYGYAVKRMLFSKKRVEGTRERVGKPGIGAIDCRIECLSLKCKMDSCKQFCT